MTKFSKKIPMARDSTPDTPRSWWDKQIIEQAADGNPEDRHPVSKFNAGRMKSPLAATKPTDFKRRRAAEAAAAERLTPYNRLTDLLGKAYAAPLTLAGSVAGATNVAAARIAGDKRARISVGDNGIQFESGYFGDERRAFTLGNAVLHGPGSTAERPNQRYDKQPTDATTAEHESGHTYQYQHPISCPQGIDRQA